MSLGKIAWMAAMVAGCAGAGPQASQSGPPPPQDMDPAVALGLWRSNFGAVKLEPDNSRGGLQSGALHGVWQYDRQGQEVIGYFAGSLRGNVLSFRWQEPETPPLVGDGFIVFDQTGRQFSGRWRSDGRDRVGVWNGWRPPLQTSAPAQVPPAQPLPPQAPSAQPPPAPSPRSQTAPGQAPLPYELE